MVNEITPVGDEVTVHLITSADQETMEKQVEYLSQVQDSFAATSTPFTWEIDASPNFHARSITTRPRLEDHPRSGPRPFPMV
jgi:hypothetical protein